MEQVSTNLWKYSDVHLNWVPLSNCHPPLIAGAVTWPLVLQVRCLWCSGIRWDCRAGKQRDPSPSKPLFIPTAPLSLPTEMWVPFLVHDICSAEAKIMMLVSYGAKENQKSPRKATWNADMPELESSRVIPKVSTKDWCLLSIRVLSCDKVIVIIVSKSSNITAAVK